MKFLLILLLSSNLYAGGSDKNIFKISFYCNQGPKGIGCRPCNGRWAIHNLTASGKVPRVGVTAASNRFKFGTKVFIEGIGERIIQDRMGSSHKGIDVFVRTHREAKKLGIQYRKVKVL